MDNKYKRAYKEVLEIIKYFPEDEYNKIPKEKIDFFKENMDESFEFTINPAIELSEQNISKEANAIFVKLYLDYFATESQKQTINSILELNEKKAEIEKREKYNPDDLFKSEKEVPEKTSLPQETTLIEYKENFFTKFKKFIFKILHIKD